jgi:hypothetical protein
MDAGSVAGVKIVAGKENSVSGFQCLDDSGVLTGCSGVPVSDAPRNVTTML